MLFNIIKVHIIIFYYSNTNLINIFQFLIYLNNND